MFGSLAEAGCISIELFGTVPHPGGKTLDLLYFLPIDKKVSPAQYGAYHASLIERPDAPSDQHAV